MTRRARNPHILHRIRLGTDVLPPEAAYYEMLWRQLHPHWEHVTWTRHNLPPLRNRAMVDRADDTGHRSDLVRREVIRRFGGVHVDLDGLRQRQEMLDRAEAPLRGEPTREPTAG